MSTQKHIFAIRYNGKTLGVRDAQQLVRLVDTDQLQADDKVFVIAEKRWINLTEVPEVMSYLALKEMNRAPVANAPLQVGRTGHEYDTMVNELETLRAPQTIVKPRIAPSSQRLTQTLIAARRPNPEGPSRYARVVLIAGTAALVIGMVFGFFAFDAWVAPKAVPGQTQAPSLLLQAQKDLPDRPTQPLR